MRLCSLNRRVSLRRCTAYFGLVCLLRFLVWMQFWRSDPVPPPRVEVLQLGEDITRASVPTVALVQQTAEALPHAAPGVKNAPMADTIADHGGRVDLGTASGAVLLHRKNRPKPAVANTTASVSEPSEKLAAGVRGTGTVAQGGRSDPGRVPSARMRPTQPLDVRSSKSIARILPPRSHFAPVHESSAASVGRAKVQQQVSVATPVHDEVLRPSADGSVALLSDQPIGARSHSSRSEPQTAAKSKQKGHPSGHVDKAHAAMIARSSHEKSHGVEHHDPRRGVFNWGSRLVEPVQLPDTIWIGFHDHMNGDNADWHEHAVPFPVDASTIHFRNLAKETAIVVWEAPDPGLYKWDILGYRVQWRREGQPWPPHDPGSGAASSGGSTEQGGTADVMTLQGSPSVGTDQTETLVKTFASSGLYYFRVRAWNHGGAGAWSAESYALWPPTPPEPPTGLHAVAIPVSGLNVTWSPSVTSGTQACSNISLRDIEAGICTTVGTGLPIDSYKLEIARGVPTSFDHWQGAVKIENMTRGVMPSAPGIPGSVHLMVDPDFRPLLPNTVYSFRVSAHNGAGWSQPSGILSIATLGPPARPGTVAYTEAGRDFLRLVWSAPSSTGNAVVRYRVFGSSWNERSNDWEAATRFTLTTDTKRPYGANPLATPTPRPASLAENEWLEFFFGWQGDSAIADENGVIHYLADFLSPETKYRFVVCAVSASGESLPSLPSSPMSTLSSAPRNLRAYIGPPCVYLGASRPTEFLASSNGKNAKYTWQLPDGSPIGRCLNDNCATMEYTFPAAGPHRKHTGGGDAFEVALLAYNRAGITRVQTHVHVNYCGCTDPLDPSFDPYADYMVPRECSRQQSWQGAPSELPRGSTTPFQVHFDPSYIFGVEITLRVDTGQVAMCYSTRKVPDQYGVTPTPLFDHPFQRTHGTWATNIVVHQPDSAPAVPLPAPTPPMTPIVVPGSEVDGEHCEFGISAYRVLTVPYARLAPTRRQQREGTPPTSIYIGLKGTHGFTRFELLARPLSFEGVPRTTLHRDKSARGPHTTGPVEGEVVVGQWAFYEVPLGRLGLADLEIQLSTTSGSSGGCVSLYSSWDEAWPSPLRQTSSNQGYERSLNVGTGCASGTASGTASGHAFTTIQPLTGDLRRTLSIGITGNTQVGEPHDTHFVLEVIRHDYTSYDKPIRLLEGMTAIGSLQSSSSADRVLGHQRIEFFEIFAEDGVAQVQLTVKVGQLGLLCATAGLPTLGRYAKQWALPNSASSAHQVAHSRQSATQQHLILVDVARDCGMPANTSAINPYFWSEQSVSKEDELRQRVSLRGHVSGAHGERTSVYLSVVGIGADIRVGTEGNVYEFAVATADAARVGTGR